MQKAPEARPIKPTRRRVLVPLVHSVDHDGGTLFVEQIVPAEAWDAGLTAEQRARDLAAARREFERLTLVLQGHSKWPRWRERGADEFRWLAEQCLRHKGEWLTLLAYQAPVPSVQRRGAGAFQAVLDTIYRRAYPVYLEGEFVQVAPRCLFVEPRANAWRRLALSVLRACGEPRDEWHQAACLALILCPELAKSAVQHGFWLAPPEPGQTDLERQAATMVGAPDTTERAAVRAKRDARRALGYVPPRARTGPKPGSRRPVSRARAEFVQYVVSLRKRGASLEAIAEEAQACALYRNSRRDPLAELNKRVIGRALRANDKTTSS